MIKLNLILNITWSKLIAFIILIAATTIDLVYNNGGKTFMYAIPFIVFLLTGKQAFDWLEIKEAPTLDKNKNHHKNYKKK